MLVVTFLFNNVPTTSYKYYEVVNMFKEDKVKDFTLDFGSGALEMHMQDDSIVQYSVPNILIFLEDIEPSVEEYNQKNPDKPVSYTHLVVRFNQCRTARHYPKRTQCRAFL